MAYVADDSAYIAKRLKRAEPAPSDWMMPG
jgi:hypothetical protein